jgi:DNA-binding NarL/FixJ family response regulator
MSSTEQLSRDVDAPSSRVALVDDHPLFRIGLRAVLEEHPRMDVVFDVESGGELLDRAKREPLDVLVLDLVLPGEGGARIASQLLELQPGCKILVLSMLDEPIRISEVLRNGASGFALKSQPVEEIVDAIQLVLGGVRYLPPSISRAQVDELLARDTWTLSRLTAREREVFDLLVQGFTNDEIATRLFIARRTVEAHRHHVMHKLGARSLVDLVRLAVRHGVPGI